MHYLCNIPSLTLPLFFPDMARRWTAAVFLEAARSLRKLRGHAEIKFLLQSPWPNTHTLKKAA